MNIWLDYKRDTNWISEDHNPHSKKNIWKSENKHKEKAKLKWMPLFRILGVS